MHTDEYAITSSREVNICNKKLKAIEKFLSKMESKYKMKTEVFIEEYKKGEGRNNKDFDEWKENYEALKLWKERKKQYDEIYRRMR
jgi:hypothetical protein